MKREHEALAKRLMSIQEREAAQREKLEALLLLASTQTSKL